MQRQALFRVVVALMLATSTAIANGDSTEKCFDFAPGAPKVEKLLKTLPPGVQEKSGTIKADTYWASFRGTVDKPIARVLALFRDHDTTKSKRVDETEVRKLPDPRYLDFHEVQFKIFPFPFVTVEWVEQWAYALLAGSAAEPVRVLVSQQKASGTKHIEHLCGQMLLEKKGASSTEVTLYEEARATNRTEKETLSGLKGTIETLKKAGGS